MDLSRPPFPYPFPFPFLFLSPFLRMDTLSCTNCDAYPSHHLFLLRPLPPLCSLSPRGPAWGVTWWKKQTAGRD